ncbi:hypothetical protein CUMW_186020 [Citrus unshiu]|nr:hypothetical protein CUMW_186020 [Citrus unshiu]
MPVAEGVTLDDVARETSDMSRFVNFYQELFGFEETASFEIEGTKEKGIETFFTGNTLTDEKAKRAFFFDPDGNLLEVQSTPC